MSDDILVSVDNVSKKFCRSLRRSLWYGVKDVGADIFGRTNYDPELRKDEFWAVKDLSFTLRRGDCLGLIGPNGAGKSTLLKMLNGLLKPDRGQIKMRGRIGALIELGTGFNPILTGRENIYINGSVLGFTRSEIDKKLDSIVDFAEIDDFLDTPVQSYSSGMKVRLGFSVAAQMEPDVLLIDEVLAVGDVGFRAKCYNVITQISKNAAVLFVSHQMTHIARLCTDVLVLDSGREIAASKDVPSSIERYYDLFPRQEISIVGSNKAQLNTIRINPSSGDQNGDYPTINYLDDIQIDLEYTVDRKVSRYVIHVGFFDMELKPVAQCFSHQKGVEYFNSGEVSTVQIRIPSIPFTSGVYSINVAFTNRDDSRRSGEILARYHGAAHFRVVGSTEISHAPILLDGDWSDQS